MPFARPGRTVAGLLIAILFLPTAGSMAASQEAVAAGSIRGVTATQNGTIPLGGVVISLVNTSGEVSSAVSEADGSFTFGSVVPGAYSLVAAVQGFDPLKQPV